MNRNYPRNTVSSYTFSSPPSTSATPAGLGFGFERGTPDSKRLSYASGGTSDGADTVEIATPVYHSDSLAHQSAYLRYVGQGGANSPVRMVRGYDVPVDGLSSSQTRSGSRQSNMNISSHSSEGESHTSVLKLVLILEFRLAAAPIRRPTLIATPPHLSNSGGERRRSFTAVAHYLTDDDDITNDRPGISPNTFGANHDTEVANPLESLENSSIPPSPAVLSTGKRDSTPTQRYSAVPSFVQDFPSPPIGSFREAHDTQAERAN